MTGRGHWKTYPATPTHLHWTPTPAPTRRRQLPWLLLPQRDDHHGKTISLTFVDVLTGNRLNYPLEKPITTSWRCRGSSHGWLAILDESPNVVVFSPLTGEKHSLPPLSTLPPVIHFDGETYELDPKYAQFDDSSSIFSLQEMRDLFIKKIILSDCPRRNPNLTALVIFREDGKGAGNLACCKSGQAPWILIPGTNVEDAVYFEGKVYAVSPSGSIYTCDVNCDSPEIVKLEIAGSEHVGADAYYLVSACDELLLVSRLLDATTVVTKGMHETLEFGVFKLSSCEGGKKWEAVHDMGDRALFVGANSCSSALKASEFPGCRRNFIYYTDADDLLTEFTEVLPKSHDMGCFLLDDKSFGSMGFVRYEDDLDELGFSLDGEAFGPLDYDERFTIANPTWYTSNP